MRKSQGFTLIELIIVIVILSILSVVAAPKFIDLSSDARLAKLQEIKSSLETGARLIHAKSIMQGKDKGLNSVQLDGGISIETFAGYPVGHLLDAVRYVI